AFSACTTRLEKPHCGKSGVPFMNNTTGDPSMVVLIRSITSIFLPPTSLVATHSAAPANQSAYDEFVCHHARNVVDAARERDRTITRRGAVHGAAQGHHA